MVLTRDESLDYFVDFINKLPDVHRDRTLETIAKTIGRRNAKTCLNTFLDKFKSKREAIILYVMEGACASGHNDLLAWAIEHHQELTKKHAAKLLQHVEIPSSLELLLGKYGCDMKSQDYSEALNSFCAKGKSLCVKVLIDNWHNSTDSDIENALQFALKEEHFGTVYVISESLSIPHEMITEIFTAMKGNGETRSHSAYPSTNTQRPPSVLSRKNFTPCIYDDTLRRTNRKLCVMRCLSKQYFSTETNVYSRAYRLSNLVHDNNISHLDKLHQCQEILAEKPTIYEDLIIESAVQSCGCEDLLFMFLVKYPTILEKIFSSCRKDKKRCQCLLINLQKIYKKTGQQFLPSIVDFLRTKDISALITNLNASECIIDIEEFISTLGSLIETRKDIAEILLDNIEEITLHTSTIVSLKLSCKRNQINVFRFIWTRSRNQIEIISDFLSKDIVDKSGEIIHIMLPDVDHSFSVGEMFVKCLRHRSRRWLSGLFETCPQHLIEDFECIIAELNADGDSTSLNLLIQVLKFNEEELIYIMKTACLKGLIFVVKHLLKMKIYLPGGVIVELIKTLPNNWHHDIAICFEELFKNITLMELEYVAILDAIVSRCSGSNDIIAMLQRLVLIPCFAAHVFSLEIISLIRIDFFIKNLSVILRNLVRFPIYRTICGIERLVSSLTVCQKNRIIQIILESPLTRQCFSVLAEFLSRCRDLEPVVGKALIDKVFSAERHDMGIHCNSIVLCVFENVPSLIENDILLNYLEKLLGESFGFDLKIKKSAFELAFQRASDCSNAVMAYFHKLLLMKKKTSFPYSWYIDEERFGQHLIDNDYLDRSQMIDVIKLCLPRDDENNEDIAKLILKKDKVFRSCDKAEIFKIIYECKNISVGLVECVLQLFSNDIDNMSLEAGFSYLLQRNMSSYITSKIIVDTMVCRRVNITCNALSLFDNIFDLSDNVSSVKLLNYILKRYREFIQGNAVEGFNKAVAERNTSVALEICKAFPERISLTEYILLWFLDDREFNKKPELFIELSKSLHVAKKTCMKFASGEISRNDRWKTIISMFGSSVTAYMKWKLLCLWLRKGYLPYWLSDYEIELTNEQVTYLKQKYLSRLVEQVLNNSKII